MRKLKTMLAAAFICMAMPMSAQNNSSVGSNDAPASYSRFTVGYNSNKLSGKDDDDSLDGFAAQYLIGKKVSDTMPLYVEYGGRLTMGFWSDEDNSEDIEVSVTKMSVSIPVNLTYRVNIGDGSFFAPYAGLHLTGNVLGSMKVDYQAYDKSFSMFDKGDVGKNAQWTRLQCGMQVGANFSFNKFNIGLEYGFDFNDICKKVSTSDFMFSVGINF